MEQELIHAELSRTIIGAAMAVSNELKPGLDERLYERALVLELRHMGHQVEQQKNYSVYYRGEHIGSLIPDMVVDDLVIVDPKVVSTFNENHLAQMAGYLAISGLHLAILMNFKFSKLQWKRVVHSDLVDPSSSTSA